MRKRNLDLKGKIIIIAVGVIILINLILVILSSRVPDIGAARKFKCDVKVFSLKTKIEITDDSENVIGIVKGKVIRFFTDPLTMYDSNDKVIAYGDDDYHLISQDSHAIFVDGKLVAEMIGKVDFFGDTYEIYDANGSKIANAEFNMFNTYGVITGTNGEIWADYSSNYIRQDFNIRIKDECPLSDRAVCMIMCSFYSDFKADNENNDSN